ncbi:hypothetical protein C8F04DRAFT_1090942 [Mycena alexandri]|uniref:Uncharacterized protein n=1 Tax=Mycena alexandri TaxID=1745969 RepID=A0AAD6XAC7_9AGAR|nr:hypothetical protein C8F04DRAFT_1090942 [Mycena alexandri]
MATSPEYVAAWANIVAISIIKLVAVARPTLISPEFVEAQGPLWDASMAVRSQVKRREKPHMIGNASYQRIADKTGKSSVKIVQSEFQTKKLITYTGLQPVISFNPNAAETQGGFFGLRLQKGPHGDDIKPSFTIKLPLIAIARVIAPDEEYPPAAFFEAGGDTRRLLVDAGHSVLPSDWAKFTDKGESPAVGVLVWVRLARAEGEWRIQGRHTDGQISYLLAGGWRTPWFVRKSSARTAAWTTFMSFVKQHSTLLD